MKCGGVESALVNLLNRLDYERNIVDLYMLDAKGEFLDRINKNVNIIDLSNILHPVQKHLIISQNIHATIDFAIKGGYYLRAVKHGILYMVYKVLKVEMPAYRAAAVSKNIANFGYDKVFDFHGYASFTTFFGAYKLRASEKYTWCHSQNIQIDNILKCINLYDRIFTVSSLIKELYKNLAINIPVEVFYNFIDVDDIKNRAKESETHYYPDKVLNILTIGRLSTQKGYDIALKTAKILKDTGCLFRWYFCGDGEERKNLEILTKDLNLEDCIVFLGFQENPYAYLQACDIYVQPSRFEGYAVTIMEAVALRKIIISTDVSGAREAVVNCKNGFIVSLSPEEIASKLLQLINDEKLRSNFAAAAAKHTLKQSASEEMLHKYIS